MRLDPFYPILDSSAWLSRLLPLGVKLVQLRIKDLTGPSLRAEVLAAKAIADHCACQLVLNDHWRLAIELGCDYVHLGQQDLDQADVTQIKQAGIKIGISTHSEQELERALSLQPDYVALGPIYPTILKKMPWSPQGLARVKQWKARLKHIPLVGIGGLNIERAEGVFGAGADVAALVTDITLNADPEAQTRRWIELTRKYR